MTDIVMMEQGAGSNVHFQYMPPYFTTKVLLSVQHHIPINKSFTPLRKIYLTSALSRRNFIFLITPLKNE